MTNPLILNIVQINKFAKKFNVQLQSHEKKHRKKRHMKCTTAKDLFINKICRMQK